MKVNLNLSILIFTIITAAAAGIIMSKVIAHINACGVCKDHIYDSALWKAVKNDREPIKKMVPVININNNETAGELRCLSNINIIQQVLENTIKTNDDIALMAVYSEDGTILAHLKPERIGKNMFDADVELSDCIREMHKAMKSRRIYNGYKYDPLLNEYIRFIVKPLQVGNFDQNLSLLIGVR